MLYGAVRLTAFAIPMLNVCKYFWRSFLWGTTHADVDWSFREEGGLLGV